jgi:hypothetical protein
MNHFVVEYTFETSLSEADFKGAFNALKPCLEVRNIRRLRSWLAEDRLHMICEFEASDTQSLREAYRSAEVPFARMWSGTIFEFGTPTLP